MGFPRQEHWSGLPFPSPGDLSDPRIKPASPVSPALASGFFTIEPVRIPSNLIVCQVTSVVSDSLHPHGLSPTRLLCLWNFPGKNTGVGCHFFQGNLPNSGIQPASGRRILFLVAQMVNHPPAMQETWVQSLGRVCIQLVSEFEFMPPEYQEV